MRVVAPYTKKRPEVLRALAGSGRELRNVAKADMAYYWLIAGLWGDGDTFAVVEHDIVVEPGTLAAFEACPSEWCASPYPYRLTGMYAGLGCCRFRGSLIARHPDALEVVARMSDAKHPPGHWCRLDGWLRSVLEQRGEQMCLHEPVAHLGSNWPTHGCTGG